MWYMGMMGLHKQVTARIPWGGHQTKQSLSHQIEHDLISFKNV
jgi:hypothetical protein